ncbi:WD40-repeat-containing domain protein [Thelephora terrestris]|uniref:WD repeat-containing protein JIP5 n=1 Tax=Thelephora terrestris TaxID=56493 RepID=A0A9P6H423_9AGAM|nr:WD40-repeat-containing domain protein [Thelephora terrestris]
MPDISVGAQVFDLTFHPTESIVYVGLLTGEVPLKPSKRSCRGLTVDERGDRIWSVGKGKSLCTIDTRTAQITNTQLAAHECSINRVRYISQHFLATGDDDGTVKLWDPRTPAEIRAYNHHFDFISDFLWLPDKKHLVVTSGDGTLSVLDVRSGKPAPFAQSEDQEDELLSATAIKGGQKVVVGTQMGTLSIFNRKSGWGDCVDRTPALIDALCTLPSSYPSSHSTILTGSSDGLIRVVQLLPTKLLGIVADHGDFPVERVVVDRAGEGRWVGSVGHEDVLKLTDLKDIFEDEDEGGVGEGDSEHVGSEDEGPSITAPDSDEPEPEDPKSKSGKKKQAKDPLAKKKEKKGRNQIVTDPSFFSGL